MLALAGSRITTVKSASVAVIARHCWTELAPVHRIATVFRTSVEIVANQGNARHTAAAGIAAFNAITDVSIVAGQHITTDALPVAAGVTHGADIAIAASRAAILILAPGLGMTGVIGAVVTIVAVE